MKTWVSYSLLRLALFAAALTLLLLLSVPGWIAAIVAAIISFCVSYLFFGRQRARVAALLQKSREDGRDEADEDDDYDSDTLGVDPSARRRLEESDEASEDDRVSSLEADDRAIRDSSGLERDGGTER